VSEQILLKQPEPQALRVSVHDRKVIQHFPHPLEWVALEAEEAVRLGMVLIDRAYEARGDIKPADGAVKHEMIERHRRTLTKRLEVMLNTLREHKRTSTPELAKQLVETCLKEVFS
jgi:hypothetical protein